MQTTNACPKVINYLRIETYAVNKIYLKNLLPNMHGLRSVQLLIMVMAVIFADLIAFASILDITSFLNQSPT